MTDYGNIGWQFYVSASYILVGMTLAGYALFSLKTRGKALESLKEEGFFTDTEENN